MKHLFVLAIAASLSASAFGQGLPEAPSEKIDLRLEMAGEQLEKAGRDRLHGALVGVVCGSLYGLIQQDPDSKQLATGMAIGAGAGFLIFEIKGALHQERAG
ncbi:MAG TPA: hypothetical protein PKN30_12850, partial [Flavobacteriales bacterium]|nr:hypothetical protein [Flavobacteriales bacterium]